VTVPLNGSVYAFVSSNTILNAVNSSGFLSGFVTDIYGVPISGPQVQVTAAGSSALASLNDGSFILQLGSGTVDVTANPASSNPNYVSISSLAVTVNLGQIASGMIFRLSQGGQVAGYITRDGINPLPGIIVAAQDVNGYNDDTEVSNSVGQFTTLVMSTGVYTIIPELDSLQVSSPPWATVNNNGGIVFSTTFTITGGLGTLTGSLTKTGVPIQTGVLVVVTTTTLVGSPPALPALSTATVGAPIYTASSLENGTYTVSVAQSTAPTYNIYAYYPTVDGSGNVTIQWASILNVPVTAGSTIPNQNFAW
jgi:hypothetical protein